MKPKRTARRIAAAAAALTLAALTGGTATAAPRPSPPADYQAIAHPVAGRVGQTVDVEVGVRNGGPGPATADRRAYEVTAPEGTTIAPDGAAGHRCAPHDTTARGYLCAIGGDFAAGDRETLRFRIRIDKKVEGAEGWVRIVGPGNAPDPDPANDNAPIVVEITGHASGPTPRHRPVDDGEASTTLLLATTSGTALSAGAIALGAARRREH
ncbi:hypothetical protein [Streptomyces hesseae]|uniref:DUF11 domain-containing protein n=1 Tax=Streptomyces hesseae TaxID=3075519 RepID=A0ABU2SWN9_9ACTN|nr:hypothetical protein [Streptomyces sp. DSM 40473]MDT0453247.1 hypothetical protein [Streptomyces sp. DSM 40473]